MPQSNARAGISGAAIFTVALLAAEPAAAASQRSFVATDGVDNPACSLGSPCRSFAAAITATSTNGEIVVLDSGGYGPVTITQAVSIIAPAGVYAGVSVFSGDGVTVTTAAAGDRVVLRGLAINNQGSTGSGVVFNGVGQLLVADSTIAGFAGTTSSYGINFHPTAASTLTIERTVIRSSYWGINVEPQAGAPAVAAFDMVTVTQNACTALLLQNNSRVVIRRSSFVNNQCSGLGTGSTTGTALLVSADASEFSNNALWGVTPGDDAGTEFVTLSNCVVAQNSVGIRAGAASTVRLSGTSVVQNTTLGLQYNGGIMQSQGDNFVFGNASDGPAPTIVGAK